MDKEVVLRQEQTKLIKIAEAFDKLEKTEEWNTIKELVFDKSLESIERQIKNECLAENINLNKLYKLQGEWTSVKRLYDVDRFSENIKRTLQEIKKKL